MGLSLDEFIEKYSAVRVLAENLKTNLDALTDLSKDDKDRLMRVNMIMVRQCLQDFGVE